MGVFYSKEPVSKPLFELLKREKINLSDLIRDFTNSCCEFDHDTFVPVYHYKMALFEYIMLYLESYTHFLELDYPERRSIADNLGSQIDEHYPSDNRVDEDRPAMIFCDDEIYTGIDIVSWPNSTSIKPLNFKSD